MFSEIFVFEVECKYRYIIESLAAVAQLDRVLGYEPRGRGFDSCQPHQLKASRFRSRGFFIDGALWSGLPG